MMQFSTKRQYGGLKDQDRIFTNLYKDGDPFIDGALRRVSNMIRDSESDPNLSNLG
jgi:hypothetical protein